MKKSIALLLALVLSLSLLCGCGESPADKAETPAEAPAAETETPAEAEAPADKTETPAEAEAPAPVSVETLRIAFSPYADSDAILTATEPLKAMLKAKLLEKGYDVENIELSVGTNYSAVGEALSAGSADLGFLSGTTYVLYSEDCDVLLTALRYAINKDSEDPADWNDGTLEQNTEETSTYYRCIILAGPSEKGRALAEKLGSGEKLSWEDLDGATWSVLNPSSSSGYIYPSLWLLDNYGHGINELSHVVQADSHSTSVARLAAGQADVMVSFGHIRLKNAAKWQSDFGGTAPMEEQTWVIGVTQGIYNDMIAYSKSSELMADEAFRTALGESFIELAQTEEGQAVFGVFSQIGYTWGKDSDYDGERAAQALLRELGE